MLVALRCEGVDRYIPNLISENSVSICRYTPDDIFALQSFQDIMPTYQKPLFASRMRENYQAYCSTGKSREPYVFSFAFSDPQGKLIPCWCAAHYLGGDTDLHICEFELHNLNMSTLAVPAKEDFPSSPVNTLDSDPMDTATNDSLQSRSQPLFFSPNDLEALDNADDRSLEIVGLATKIQQQFASATIVQDLLDTIVGIVHELTKFHRCMIYKFDANFNGSVEAELIDPKASVDFYKGLHFPSTDIPKQARDLYKINKVRVLFDRAQETARLIARVRSDIAVPLDLTHSYLRAMSPVHLKYLANMGVRSSLSMSLECEGKLWGLICCHSYGPTATRVPFRVRELCYYVGVAASTCLEKILHADKFQGRKILDTLQHYDDPNECITASSSELLKLFDADFGFFVVDGEARTIGKLVSYTEAVTLLKYFYFRRSSTIYSSSCIVKDLTDLDFEPGFQAIAGVMYVPLSMAAPDFVVFFRKDQLKEVHWAGKPALHSKVGVLEPRNSFKKWTEIVRGTSREWTAEQLNMAAMVQLVHGRFIGVWREKQTAINDSRMKRLLLHDASHQVRTPLNAVINYLEMALEKPLDEGTKQILSMSHSASKSLVYVIDDLLHLTGSTSGSLPELEDPFDIKTALEDTIDALRKLTATKKLGLRLVEKPGNARYVRGDPLRFQRAVSNLITNAVKNTAHGDVTVEWTDRVDKSKKCTTRVAVKDTGPGLSERELDDIFQEFEQVPDEDADEFSEPVSPQRDNVLRLGVGLAFVARYVKARNGQLIVASLKGRGSTFTLEVPFIRVDNAAHPMQSINSKDTIIIRRDASPLPNLRLPAKFLAPAAMQQTAFRGPTPEPDDTAMSPPPLASSGGTFAPTPSGDLLVVLMADDNSINVQILEKRLTKLGHRVEVSRDGQECFDAFVENRAKIDFVLMDLNVSPVPPLSRLLRSN
jgi:light-regulated signal transduction histidine kinase (bacteriophytochrome)